MATFHRQAILAIAGALVALGAVASAQVVTLRSADGSVELSGELLDYDGEFYKIKSRFGELTLNALGVTCSGLNCPDPGQFASDVTVSGASSALEDLVPGLIESFSFNSGLTIVRGSQQSGDWTYFIADSTKIPVARIQGTPNGSTSGFQDLASGRSDLIVSHRLPVRSEVEAARKGEIGDILSPWQRVPLAQDALVFIIHPDNPIRALSSRDIRNVFSGHVTNWSDVGGLDAPIELLLPSADSDLWSDFLVSFFGETEEMTVAEGKTIPQLSALSDAVSDNPFAIGITNFAGIRNARPVALKEPCGIRQFPTVFNLQSGDYPLTRTLYIFKPQKRLPMFARSLLAFVENAASHKSIRDQGYAPQAVSRLEFFNQQERIANVIRAAGDEVDLEAMKGFVRALSDASRLSATFRFGDNSIEMDLRSKVNIETLAQMLEFGEFDGRTLLFVGFSDSQGAEAGNRRLSRTRAEEVSKIVQAAASRADLSRVTIKTIGMGEVSPLACNDTEDGRRINRRVEVWLK